jgi:hypothetical protein
VCAPPFDSCRHCGERRITSPVSGIGTVARAGKSRTPASTVELYLNVDFGRLLHLIRGLETWPLADKRKRVASAFSVEHFDRTLPEHPNRKSRFQRLDKRIERA